jgi:hypothetical protein
MATGASNQQTARAGEFFAAAELNKRGAYAVTFAGNMPSIDILASNRDQSRTVRIQVKTKRSGSWQTSIDRGKRCEPRENEDSFWIFVDLGKENDAPKYYIVPEWWIRNDIYEAHQSYLRKHGGKRKFSQDSKHHSIDSRRIQEWEGKWDVLGIS